MLILSARSGRIDRESFLYAKEASVVDTESFSTTSSSWFPIQSKKQRSKESRPKLKSMNYALPGLAITLFTSNQETIRSLICSCGLVRVQMDLLISLLSTIFTPWKSSSFQATVWSSAGHSCPSMAHLMIQNNHTFNSAKSCFHKHSIHLRTILKASHL